MDGTPALKSTSLLGTLSCHVIPRILGRQLRWNTSSFCSWRVEYAVQDSLPKNKSADDTGFLHRDFHFSGYCKILVFPNSFCELRERSWCLAYALVELNNQSVVVEPSCWTTAFFAVHGSIVRQGGDGVACPMIWGSFWLIVRLKRSGKHLRTCPSVSEKRTSCWWETKAASSANNRSLIVTGLILFLARNLKMLNRWPSDLAKRYTPSVPDFLCMP